MTSSTPAKASETAATPLMRELLYAAWYYLGGRRGLWILAAGALVAGLAFNWSWLVAAGIAPVLIAVLPCVAMCALGLCANKMAGRTDAPRSSAARVTAEPESDSQAPAPRVGSAVGVPMACCAESHESAAAAAAANVPRSQPLEERRNPDA